MRLFAEPVRVRAGGWIRTSVVDPKLGTTDILYDASGNVILTWENGNSTTFNFDALNRMTSKLAWDPTWASVVYTYDDPAVAYGKGRLTSVAGPNEGTAYSYKPNGMLNGVARTVDSEGALTMSVDNVVDLLATKRDSLSLLVQQRRFGPEYRILLDEVLQLERAVAERRGEPHAVEVALAAWNGMAYYPMVFGSASNCAIVFATREREYATFAFSEAAGYKLTDVSDETIQGHPLTGKGLTPYRAFVVKNSQWIGELEAVDRVHPQHVAEKWHNSHHYLLCFKDRMFEAIAQDVQLIGTFRASAEALGQAMRHVESARMDM